MTELTQTAPDSDAHNIIISGNDIPHAAYQAIYHKLTKRVERITREYNEAYTINIEDIKNLNDRLAQALFHYPITGRRCEIVHSTKDGEVNTYSSIEKFMGKNHSAREYTSNFCYEYDFLISLQSDIIDAKDVAQRYKLRIVFDQTFFSKDDPKIPFFMRGFTSKSELRMVLEYADFSIAQMVEGVVSGWIKSLPKKKVSAISNILNNLESSVRHFVSTFAHILPMFFGAFYILSNKTNIHQSAAVILIAISAGYFGYAFVGYLIDRFYNVSRKLTPCACVLITAGDKDRLDETGRSIIKTRATLGFLAVTILASFLVNLSSSWLYDIVTKWAGE